MGLASKIPVVFALVLAVAALPAQAGASPAAGEWPTVAQVKRAVSCSWSADAKGMSCPLRGCAASLDIDKSSHGDGIVRVEMVVDVHYDPRNRRAERRNIACAKKVLDLFFPTWKARGAWFDAAVARALRTEATSTRRVGGKTIAVEYQSPSDLPDIYVGVTIK